MVKIIKRYKWLLLLLTINIVVGVIYPEIGKTSFQITKSNFLQILSVIPPIFILLGLLDVWIDRSTMIKYLGKKSGTKGALIALLLGSVAAGPLYAAFPISLVMLKKRASIFNVFIFIGAWSTTKIPMESFEIASLGYKFALTRLALSLIGIFIIAFILDKTLNEKDKEQLYKKADSSI
ncbi:MAG: permease [Sphaerochaetaceae bacterium]|nr:permease [Sphaerochaetaceae bacterium]